MAGLASAILPQGETLWHLVAAPEEDGAWRVIRLDGRNIAASGFRVHLRWGKIAGVHDGCNNCGMSGDPAGYICTLAACVEQPGEAAFRALVRGEPTIDLTADTLTLRGQGHSAELVRAD